MDDRTELLHRVRGSVDVALSMVGRSTDLYGCRGAALPSHILAGLADAAASLAVVADALEEELHGYRRLGPVA